MYYLINQEDFLRAIVGDSEVLPVCHGLHHLRLAARQRRRQRDDEGVQPEEGAAAAQGGRLQGRADHRPGGDRPQHHHAGDAGADPGDARGRHQRRRAVDGLGLGGLAPRQEGAAGAGRLEHLRHHHRAVVGSANPVLHTWIGAACDKGLFGWPCDPEIEKLRNAYGFAQTDEEKKKIARDLQTRAMEQVVYIPFGQWDAAARLPRRPHRGHRAQHRPGRCSGTSRKK